MSESKWISVKETPDECETLQGTGLSATPVDRDNPHL